MPLTPKNRKEEWLQGLVDHETTLTPKNRPEEWMKEIIDASGGGGGGIDLGITGASVGEYAKIKTVDADGVPTAWESGSGGGVSVLDIDPTQNNTVTIENNDYDHIDLVGDGGDGYEFVLVSPDVFIGVTPIVRIYIEGGYILASELAVGMSSPISASNVASGVIFSAASIPFIVAEYGEHILAIIPNNATYELGEIK